MTSIIRTSSGASANMHLASAPAEPARTPAADASAPAAHTPLSDRPPALSGAGADRPRMALNSLRLSSLRTLADNAGAAATVFQQVHDGTIQLRGSYPAAALRAASMAASQGVLALQRDAVRHSDPPTPASA